MKYKLLKTITGMMDRVIFFLDKSLLKKQPIDNYYSLYKKNLNQSFYFRVSDIHRHYKTFTEEKYSDEFRFKFFVAKDKNNKVNELLISTTFIDLKEKPHSRWEEKINELVKLGLVYISKDKKSGQIKSIKTNKKCNILNLKKIKGFSYQKIGLGDIVSELQSDETFKSVAKEMGEENIIKSYIKNIVEPDKKLPLNSKNLDAILKLAKFKKKLISGEFTSENPKIKNSTINIKSGKLFIHSIEDNLEIEVPKGNHVIYEIYDETYARNKKKEKELLKDHDKMQEIEHKYTKTIYQEYKDEEEAITGRFIEVTDDDMVEKHGFDHSRLVAHIDWEKEKPNIHFLYFDFRK